jgi:hypothetical protein
VLGLHQYPVVIPEDRLEHGSAGEPQDQCDQERDQVEAGESHPLGA